MARDLSKSKALQRFPVIPLCLAAAVLTALATITHSGIICALYPKLYEAFLYDQVGRNPNQKHSFLDTKPKFNRTKYTFDSFVVAEGIDLAGFGLDGIDTDEDYDPVVFPNPYFELFEDFDLSQNLIGTETWIELLEYRRDATHPSLSFYVDKVAFKRWLLASYSKLQIAGPKSYLLKYASELYRDVESVRQAQTAPESSAPKLLTQELLKWLPSNLDYAAKPTHLSCSGGVWLVHNDVATNTTYVGNGKKKMQVYGNDSTDIRIKIAEDLSENLQKVQEKCGRTVIESYALRHVRPGIVVEERFTQPTTATNNSDDDDDEAILKGGMEFKVFTIWGRAWLTVWRPGTDGVKALLFRNGTNLVYDPPVKQGKPPKAFERHELPEWLEWNKVIEIAERLGRHKDMFRTDIFVGVANGDNNNIRYVVSETEIHPTPLRGFELVFEEAGRLWLAGYYYLFGSLNKKRLGESLSSSSSMLRVVRNTEVPESFFHRNIGRDEFVTNSK